MKEPLTKLAINFGPGEAFEVFVGREQLGKAVAVLAGRWAEVTVGGPCAAQPDPEALVEKLNAEADRKRGAGLADLLAKVAQSNDEKYRKEWGDAFRVGQAVHPPNINYLGVNGWGVTFNKDPFRVHVNGKLDASELQAQIAWLFQTVNGPGAARECIRVALHFLKDRFVMMPINQASVGRPISHVGLFVFPDKVECWNENVEARIEAFANELHPFNLTAALFYLVNICDQERGKNVTGTAVEAPPAIVDGIDTSHGVAIIGKPERAAHLCLGGSGWNVFYWESDGVEIHGNVDWAAFERNIEQVSDHPGSGPHIRQALEVAWWQCVRRGLLTKMQPEGQRMAATAFMTQFYANPDAIWINGHDTSVIDSNCYTMDISDVKVALLIATRMLADAAKKPVNPQPSNAHLCVSHDDWSVTYWEDGEVEFKGEPCYGRFLHMVYGTIAHGGLTHIRNALEVALIKCSKLGLLDVGVTQPARDAFYYGVNMRVYRHPDHIWLCPAPIDLIDFECSRIDAEDIVEVLTVVTRMLGGAK